MPRKKGPSHILGSVPLLTSPNPQLLCQVVFQSSEDLAARLPHGRGHRGRKLLYDERNRSLSLSERSDSSQPQKLALLLMLLVRIFEQSTLDSDQLKI